MMDNIHALASFAIGVAGIFQMLVGSLARDFDMESRGLFYIAIAGIWGQA